MLFWTQKIIASLSGFVPFRLGDIITGTPAGVGVGMKPSKYPLRGDIVALSIDGLDELTRQVKAIDT